MKQLILAIALALTAAAGAGDGLAELQAATALELQQRPDDRELQKLAAEIQKNRQREQMFAAETNPEMLEKIGAALRQFYLRHGLHAQAEAAARKVYDAKPSDRNALPLAESLLDAGKNREAAELIAARAPDDENRGLLLYAALAFARAGEAEPARQYLDRVGFDHCSPQELMLYAMTAARLGDAAMAAPAVAKMLLNAPAKETAMLREYFRTGDFAEVCDAAVFQEALATESQAGDGCGGCPNRGTSRCGGGDCD